MESTTFFYLSFFIPLAYFLLVSRRVDFFLCAFASCQFYHLPGFYGIAYEIKGIVPIISDTYWVMGSVNFSFLIGAIIFDTLPPITLKKINVPKKIDDNFGTAAIIVSIIGLSMLFIFSSELFVVMLQNNKRAAMNILKGNRSINIWVYGAAIAFVYYVIRNKHIPSFIALGLLAIHVYLGFYSVIAFALMSIGFYYFFKQGKMSFFKEYFLKVKRLLIILLIAVVAMMFITLESAINLIKGGKSDYLIANLTNIQYYTAVLEGTEGFGQCAFLNKTLRDDIRTDMLHPVDLFMNMIFFAPELGFKTINNYIDQTEVFPTATYGRANNIWAFMWSSGGTPLLVTFIIFFNLYLGFGNFILMRTKSASVQAIIIFFIIESAFFIHRKNLFSFMKTQKFILAFGLALIFVALIIHLVKKELRRQDTQPKLLE